MNNLKILYLEDSVQDAELTGRVLKNAGIEFSLKLVDTQEEFTQALKEYSPDLILADHSLFQFNSSQALKLFHETNLKIPFILVTGTVSEEFAVNILKQGADDYLLKSNLVRLPNAVLNNLEKYRLERERQQYLDNIITKEGLMKEAEQLAHFGSWEADALTGEVKWSDEVFRIYGYMPGEITPGHDIILHHIHPADRTIYQHAIFSGLPDQDSYASEVRIIDKNGINKFLYFKLVVKRNNRGQLSRLIGFMQDITERKLAEESIRKSNERYQFVNKATLDVIWEWDFYTGVGLWGEGLLNMFGYGKDKLKYDESWQTEYIHPEDRERVSKNIEYHLENKLQNWQDEYRFRSADGSYRYVYDRGFILFDKDNKPYRMIGAMTDMTEKRNLEKELAEHELYQQKLITEVTIEAQEKQRNELGRELHDNINQVLSMVKMFLSMALEKDDKREELLKRSLGNLNQAIEDIRKLSKSLVAPSLGDIGLEDSLLYLIEEMNLTKEPEIEFFSEIRDPKKIDKNMELMLYRIAQEQLNNIRKYAKATKAIITLKTSEDNLFFSIADDGIGFDTTSNANGIGLKNIRSRVDFYSGTVNILSAPGKGCVININLPLKQ
jgi:two-component system, NarL family, sensor histidine kinase UhpB